MLSDDKEIEKIDINECFKEKLKFLKKKYFNNNHRKLASHLGISIRTLYDYLNDKYIKEIQSTLPTSRFISNFNNAYKQSNSDTFNFFLSINIKDSDFYPEVSLQEFIIKTKNNILEENTQTKATYIIDDFNLFYYSRNQNHLNSARVSIKSQITDGRNHLYADVIWYNIPYTAKVEFNDSQLFISFHNNDGYNIIINLIKTKKNKIFNGIITGITKINNSIIPISNKCLLIQIKEKVQKKLVKTILTNEVLSFWDNEMDIVNQKNVTNNVTFILNHKTDSFFNRIENYIDHISNDEDPNIYYDMVKNELSKSKKKILKYLKKNDFKVENGEDTGLTFLNNISKYSSEVYLLTTPNDNLRTSVYYNSSKKSREYQDATLKITKKVKLQKIFSIRTNTFKNANYLQRVVDIMLELYHSNVDVLFTYNTDKAEYLEIALSDNFAAYMERTNPFISNVTTKAKKIAPINIYYKEVLEDSVPIKEVLDNMPFKHKMFKQYTEIEKEKISKHIKEILQEKNKKLLALINK